MLQSLEISADDTAPAVPAPKPVKLNAVVTKGHIRVVPTPALQVVDPHPSDAANLGASSSDFAAPDTGPFEPMTADQGSSVQEGHSAEASQSASWSAELAEASAASSPIDSTLLLPPGLSMQMIKLIAAAAVLGVAAIVLTFLQFSGSDDAVQDQPLAASQAGSRGVATAGASTLPAASGALGGTLAGGDSADIVAQITAGTLAALRSGQVKAPAAPATAQAPLGLEQTNGLYAMVLTALQQGQSRQYIDQMVNEAHRTQRVQVPALLLTSAGEVNTTALLTLFGGQ
ncbi:hypothetical protein NBRC116598_33930 [Pseudophaeobacter arcticus]|uniref:Meckel syndrome type 1 protein n=1 Tax=Pseudophaeobacter arcticus TaxID=385492 RepID=A0ABQ0AQ33_9RHOB